MPGMEAMMNASLQQPGMKALWVGKSASGGKSEPASKHGMDGGLYDSCLRCDSPYASRVRR